MDWKEIKDAEHVVEVSKLVGEFRVYVMLKPGPITVRVYEYPDGRFEGVSNYSIKPPERPMPYKSLNYRDSVEEALLDSISGLLALYPEDKEEQKKCYH